MSSDEFVLIALKKSEWAELLKGIEDDDNKLQGEGWGSDAICSDAYERIKATFGGFL